jgi:hypothetical protein
MHGFRFLASHLPLPDKLKKQSKIPGGPGLIGLWYDRTETKGVAHLYMVFSYLLNHSLDFTEHRKWIEMDEHPPLHVRWVSGTSFSIMRHKERKSIPCSLQGSVTDDAAMVLRDWIGDPDSVGFKIAQQFSQSHVDAGLRCVEHEGEAKAVQMWVDLGPITFSKEDGANEVKLVASKVDPRPFIPQPNDPGAGGGSPIEGP